MEHVELRFLFFFHFFFFSLVILGDIYIYALINEYNIYIRPKK